MGLARVTSLLDAEMKRAQKKNITVRELALQIDLSPAALYSYVKGNVTPDVESLRKLAKYFNTTVADLIGEESTCVETTAKKQSSAGDIFETTMAGRPADEQLQLISLWLKLVKDFDRQKH